jgi:hypothetical protein
MVIYVSIIYIKRRSHPIKSSFHKVALREGARGRALELGEKKLPKKALSEHPTLIPLFQRELPSFVKRVKGVDFKK